MSYTKLRGIIPDTELAIGSSTPSTVSSTGVLTVANTTDSTSNTTGAIISSGGIGISDTADAISATNGGSLTTAGGVAVAKKLFVGTDVNLATVSGIATIGSSTQATVSAAGLLTIQNASKVSVTDNTIVGDEGGINVNGDIALFNATKNTIVYRQVGVNPPSFGFPFGDGRSTGSKIVLYPDISGATADMAIGVQSTGIWNSVRNSSDRFFWYAGTTSVMNLSGAGVLDLPIAVKIGNTNTLLNSTVSSLGTQGDISLYNSTSNMIGWRQAGVAVPSVTTRSVGTKLLLYPDISGVSVDMAIGVQGTGMWQSVRTSSDSFFWYGGATQISSLSGAGLFTTVSLSIGSSTPSTVSSTGVLTVANTTDSTSNTTGAIISSGGIGISDTVDAISATNGGSLTTAGGVAVAKKLFVGTDVNLATVSGITTIGSSTPTTVSAAGLLTVGNTTVSSSTITGALVVSGGVGIGGAIFATSANITTLTAPHGGLSGLLNDDHTQYTLLVGRSGGQIITGGTAASNTLTLRSTSNATKGQVYIDETTVSSSTITGALRVDGGVGIGGAIFSVSSSIGSSTPSTVSSTGVLTVANTTDSTSNTTGAIISSGGIGISDTVDAISATNGGSLTTAGGVAVAKKLFVGTDVNLATVSGVTTIGSSTQATVSAAGLLTIQNASKVTTTDNTIVGDEGGLNISGDLTLFNATKNTIVYRQSGVAAPTLTDRSVGSKIVLYPDISGATLDMAIGVQSTGIWQSVRSSSDKFFWYAGTGSIMNLSGAGVLDLTTAVKIGNTNTLLNSTASSLGTQGDIALYNATSNMIGWRQAGVAVPSVTTRSVGTKLLIYPDISGVSVDMAIGVQSTGMWQSVRTSSDNFFWYGGTTNIMTLSGTGLLTTVSSNTGSSTVCGISSTGVVTINNANKVGTTDIVIAGDEGGLNVSGDITLFNATKNTIVYRSAGVAVPSITARSAGTKIVLHPNLNATDADFAIGIQFNGTWFSVPTASQNFFWYAGATQISSISGAGLFTTVSSSIGSSTASTISSTGVLTVANTTASTSNTTGAVLVSGGIGISNTTDATSATNGGTFTTAGGAAIAKKLFVGTDLAVTGALSKGSGTFDIEHPLDSNRRLVHSFIEGPRIDNLYRGTTQLVEGKAFINLDKDCVASTECAMTEGTFEALNTNPQWFLENLTGWEPVKGVLVGNKLTIISQHKCNDTIAWLVIAERKDPFIKNWERTNQNGSLITEYN
jgi:hypothetical protein